MEMNMVSANPQIKSEHNEWPSISFLESLFKNCCQGFVNLRFSPSGTNLFIPLTKISSVTSILEARYHEDAYFAVALRREGDESKEGIVEVPGLWINLDFKNLSEERKWEIREKYRDFPLKGTFGILTGGEIHIYWLLKKPIPAERISEAEDLLKKLVSYFGDDSGVADVNQDLRIPGTLNYELSSPKEVILDVFLPDNQYTLNDFGFLLKAETPNGEDEDLALADEEESTEENITPKPQDHSLLPPPTPHKSDDSKDWIRLPREIKNSVIFQNEGLLKVWVFCLINASHEDQWALITTGRGTTKVFVKRGQFLFGRKKAAKALKMDESTIYKRMKKLKDMGNLSIQSKAHYSLVTIVNWDDCGSFREESNTQSNI